MHTLFLPDRSGWRTLGVLGGLVPTLQPMPILSLIPVFVLCLSPGTRTRTFVPGKCCLPPHSPLLQPHPAPSHNMLLPAILGCYYQQPLVGSTAIWLWVFEMHISPFWASTDPVLQCKMRKYFCIPVPASALHHHHCDTTSGQLAAQHSSHFKALL